MNLPRWKRWLSHITPLTLEEIGSELNPRLAVRLDQGRLQLLSGDAIYSWDDLYHNFTRAFAVLNPSQHPPQDVLLLGLGLGSVPFLLEKNYAVRAHYVAVEWDETVVHLAEKYTFSQLQSTAEMIVADASVFVEVCEEQFDWVVVDIFEEYNTPEAFEDTYFLEQCKARLRPGGLLLYNRLYHTPINKQRTETFYKDTFLQVFPEAWYIDTQGNWILCAHAPDNHAAH